MTQNDMSAGAPDTSDRTATTAVAPRKITRSDVRRAERAMRAESSHTVRPLRAAGTMAAVLALLAGVAIPAYAATQSGGEQVTAHEVAEADAQSLTVDEGSTASQLNATSYSATTAEEIEKKKAAEEAAKRAKEMAAAAAKAAANQSSGQAAAYTGNTTPTVSADGVVFPLPSGSWTAGRGLWDSGYHQGWDLLASANTPIFAIADGTVSSAGWSGGFGNAVFINHNIGGDAVRSTYGHMISTPIVSPGQQVSAGQVIGYVGSTGSSTANHLHIEIHINGAVVAPENWLPRN